MKKLLLAVVFCFVVFQLSFCYALDWKRLHEEADKLDLTGALLAVEERPRSVDDLYKLGLVYLNLHKDNQAGETFEGILKLNPGIIEAKWGQAEVLRRQHKLDKSEELLNEVLREAPGLSAACISLAYIEYIKMNFNKSVSLARTVLDQGENKVDSTNYVRALTLFAGAKGMIAHYGGPISKVINGTPVLPALKKAQRIQPQSAAVFFGLGSFYLLAPRVAGGDVENAVVYLEKGAKVDPNFPDFYVRLAQAYKIKGDNAKYKQYIDKALELDPGNELAKDIKNKTCKFICPGRD